MEGWARTLRAEWCVGDGRAARRADGVSAERGGTVQSCGWMGWKCECVRCAALQTDLVRSCWPGREHMASWSAIVGAAVKSSGGGRGCDGAANAADWHSGRTGTHANNKQTSTSTHRRIACATLEYIRLHAWITNTRTETQRLAFARRIFRPPSRCSLLFPSLKRRRSGVRRCCGQHHRRCQPYCAQRCLPHGDGAPATAVGRGAVPVRACGAAPPDARLSGCHRSLDKHARNTKEPRRSSRATHAAF